MRRVLLFHLRPRVALSRHQVATVERRLAPRASPTSSSPTTACRQLPVTVKIKVFFSNNFLVLSSVDAFASIVQLVHERVAVMVSTVFIFLCVRLVVYVLRCRNREKPLYPQQQHGRQLQQHSGHRHQQPTGRSQIGQRYMSHSF